MLTWIILTCHDSSPFFCPGWGHMTLTWGALEIPGSAVEMKALGIFYAPSVTACHTMAGWMDATGWRPRRDDALPRFKGQMQPAVNTLFSSYEDGWMRVTWKEAFGFCCWPKLLNKGNLCGWHFSPLKLFFFSVPTQLMVVIKGATPEAAQTITSGLGGAGEDGTEPGEISRMLVCVCVCVCALTHEPEH